MAEDITPLQRALATLGIIFFCALIGAGIAWLWPVIDASPYSTNDSYLHDEQQALRNLQQDNAQRKLERAALGALGGSIFGIAYCLIQKYRDRDTG